MVGTQIETSEFGLQNSDCGMIRRGSALRTPRSAFTLTELLVVITIIAILASLITGAALNAMKRAKQAAITLELQQIGAAVEDLKNDFGAYPPNGMIKDSGATNYFAQSDFVRMFKKAFPRSQEPDALIRALAGGPEAGIVQTSLLQDTGMTGAEAAYFWLGGFSSDIAFPISGPGGPSFQKNNSIPGYGEVLEDRNLRYEFDLSRLQPRDVNGVFDESAGQGRFIEYDDPRPGANGLRRINFWRYTPTGSTVPIVYFDTSRHSPADYDLDISGYAQQNIYALKQLREGVGAANNNTDVRWVEDKKFQIIHPGIDDIWGDAFARFRLNVEDYNANAYQPQNIILAPEGPFIGDVADTLGNFMSGTLEDKQQ